MKNYLTSFLFLSLILIITCSPTDEYRDPENPHNQLNDFLKEEEKKENDPLGYEEEVYRNSFKKFITAMTGKMDFVHSDCYFDLKGNAINNAREFINHYNHLVGSSKLFRENNFTMDINPDKECKYKDEKSFTDALHPSKSYAKNSYMILKHSLFMLVKSDFYQAFSKYTSCATVNESLKAASRWKLISQFYTYNKLFESFCSIQQVLNNFTKKIDKYHVSDPFSLIGDKFMDFFASVKPHLDHLLTK